MTIVTPGIPRLGEPGPNSYTEDGFGSMRDGNILFRPALDPDWFFLTEYIDADFMTNVPRERRILFLTEPPMVERYGLDYVQQFGALVSPYAIDGYNGRLMPGNPCIGWFTGYGKFKNLPDVRNYPIPEKTKTVSIISSLKKQKPGHRRRVAFISSLMANYGEKIDYYGIGFNQIQDKLDAIAPYKYHIAIENCRLENYWTEKLTDAWIGWSLPIYCGDPSILAQVPDPRGLEVIDISDPVSAMKRIDYILESDIYDSRVDAIAACRKWVIEKSNAYERVCEIIESSSEDVLKKPRLGREREKREKTVRRIARKRRTAWEVLGGALSWCAGAFFVWNIKRMYRNIKKK